MKDNPIIEISRKLSDQEIKDLEAALNKQSSSGIVLDWGRKDSGTIIHTWNTEKPSSKTIPIHKLEAMGLIPEFPKVFENWGSYDVHTYFKNSSQIDITTSYDTNGTPIGQYIEVNEETLRGDVVGIRQLYFLMRLL